VKEDVLDMRTKESLLPMETINKTRRKSQITKVQKEMLRGKKSKALLISEYTEHFALECRQKE
jgi:hypothetical protein